MRRVRAGILQQFPDASQLFLQGTEDEKGLTEYVCELFLEKAMEMPDADNIPEEKLYEAAAVVLRVIWGTLQYPTDSQVRAVLSFTVPKIFDTVAGISEAPGQKSDPQAVRVSVAGRLRAFLSNNGLLS